MSSRLKLAGICFAAAFALAACGGGGSPLDEARAERDRLAEELKQAQADRAAALAAQQAAEAARQAAETARQAAETARQAAEAERDAAQAAQQMAEADRDAAQAARDAAQTAQQAAEAARDAALAAQSTAESDRDTAQAARDAAQAERDRVQNDLTATQEERDAAQRNLEAANQDLMSKQTALDDATAALETRTAELATRTTELATKTAELQAKQTELADVQRQLAAARQELADAEQAKRDAEEAAQNAAMAATAAKLFAGISAPSGDVTSPAATDRAAAYNADGTAILVSAGLPADAPAAVTLSEDKKTMVAANHGWAGKRYADPAGGDSYEAVVYSNVEAPTMGKKFGGTAAQVTANEVEYELNANGGISVDTSTAGVPARVALTGVTRTAGTETFKLPDPNPGGAANILVPGSHHGVSGTYSCAPSVAANGCTATVAARGFTLGAGTWTFTPSNPNARVMDAADTAYSSYGWWLRKSEDGTSFTASAFHGFKGTDAGEISATNTLPTAGTATYMGGAAGKYALTSATGGTNDAGHFTARATLEAEFDAGDAGTISGTVDNFVGADGESRDWSVELKEAILGGTTGAITRAGANQTDNDTVWTIGGTAADASGEWSGTLRERGTDGVPQAATGTFYSEFGQDGKMVGAFGANKQ